LRAAFWSSSGAKVRPRIGFTRKNIKVVAADELSPDHIVLVLVLIAAWMMDSPTPCKDIVLIAINRQSPDTKDRPRCAIVGDFKSAHLLRRFADGVMAEKKALTALKIAVFAPIPSASANTATMVITR